MSEKKYIITDKRGLYRMDVVDTWNCLGSAKGTHRLVLYSITISCNATTREMTSWALA